MLQKYVCCLAATQKGGSSEGKVCCWCLSPRIAPRARGERDLIEKCNRDGNNSVRGRDHEWVVAVLRHFGLLDVLHRVDHRDGRLGSHQPVFVMRALSSHRVTEKVTGAGVRNLTKPMIWSGVPKVNSQHKKLVLESQHREIEANGSKAPLKLLEVTFEFSGIDPRIDPISSGQILSRNGAHVPHTPRRVSRRAPGPRGVFRSRRVVGSE